MRNSFFFILFFSKNPFRLSEWNLSLIGAKFDWMAGGAISRTGERCNENCLLNQSTEPEKEESLEGHPPTGRASRCHAHNNNYLEKDFRSEIKKLERKKSVFVAGNEIWFEQVQSCSLELQGTARWLESERQYKDLRLTFQQEQIKLDLLEPSRPMQISWELLRSVGRRPYL